MKNYPEIISATPAYLEHTRELVHNISPQSVKYGRNCLILWNVEITSTVIIIEIFPVDYNCRILHQNKLRIFLVPDYCDITLVLTPPHNVAV